VFSTGVSAAVFSFPSLEFHMQQFTRLLRSFLVDEDGATMIEYGLLAALIALVVAGAAVTLGSSLKNKFTSVSTCVETPNSTNCP
jgi:pilus assembly protein Flp/PilA